MDRISYIEPINISSSKKILKQMTNCICKIELGNERIGTGFFCSFNSMIFLMTCYSIINDKYLKENKELNLSLNDSNEHIKIDLRIKRKIYFNKENDTIFIELRKEGNIKNYFELDENLFKDNENIYYNSKSIYILQYLYRKDIHVSYGYINGINRKKEIKHNCYTDKGSIGSPILNLTTNKVIGIHKGIGYGLLLKYPLNDFRKKGYKIIKELGNGGFGKVNKVLSKFDNKYYAMKEILLQGKTLDEINNIKKEANTLSKFDCDNIVKYYDSFKDKDKYYILMEYCDGQNLKDYIEECKKNDILIEENIIYNIIKQICLGIKKIHEMNIVHRDIKPENIFINKNKEIKIGDFGISKQLNLNKTQKTNKKFGSVEYMAPEIFKNGLYNTKSDIYSLGCIIYELLTLNNYFEDKQMNTIQKINTKIYNYK